MHVLDIRLESNRLFLRPIRPEDFAIWATLMGDEKSSQPVNGSQSRATAWCGLSDATGACEIHGFDMFSVNEKSFGRGFSRLSGTVQVFPTETRSQNREAWKRRRP